ncbi:HNH endonuclease signature motif containing protein [Xanthomonas sp. WHRI 1810A]|uniref:HNH endonuclease n=1 Tax=Xanthomonas sp. WHRI 1810A TaxID=3161565 RepID=UPI0032E8D585
MAIPAVEKQALDQAIKKFDREFRNTPDWATWESNRAHKFAIRVHDQLYPAKKILSLATHLPVSEFTGGASTNGYLRARGFEIVDLRRSPKLEFLKGEIYDRRTEIHGPFGGSFQSGIAPSDRVPAIFLFAGTSGEQFGYMDEEDEHGVYSYAGEGQIGHMTLTRGNLAIQKHAATGRALHLFKSLGKSKGQRYLGEYACADLSWKDGPDREGNIRKIVVFHLVPVMDLAKYEVEPTGDLSVESSGVEIGVLRERAYDAAVASISKGKFTSTRTVYARSQAVKDYVLSRADGTCESCSRPAPFTTKAGTPYLEPHHINRLSDGGLDHPKYIGAICPTCHKEIHYGSEGETKNNLLRESIMKKEMRAT